jgi:hypothetical protein
MRLNKNEFTCYSAIANRHELELAIFDREFIPNMKITKLSSVITLNLQSGEIEISPIAKQTVSRHHLVIAIRTGRTLFEYMERNSMNTESLLAYMQKNEGGQTYENSPFR